MSIWNDNQSVQQNREFAHKIESFHNKVEKNKLRSTKIVRHKVEITTTHIHIKAINILSMTTLFNGKAASLAYTKKKVQK